MNTTIDKIRERQRVRTTLALVMALDSLDLAHARIKALLMKAERGIYDDGLHQSGVGDINRALLELRKADAASAAMPDVADRGAS
jgi:hypothetical protein